MSLNEEDDEDMLLLGRTMLQMEGSVTQTVATKQNHSMNDGLLPREKKRRFRHKETHEAMQFDCLGPDALFDRSLTLCSGHQGHDFRG